MEAHSEVLSKVFTWGSNIYGALGILNNDELNEDDDGDMCAYLPQCVPELMHQDVVQLATTEHRNLAVTRSGNVWAWGHAPCGVLGLGRDHQRQQRRLSIQVPHDDEDEDAVMSYFFQATPIIVEGLQGHAIAQVACGHRHSLALTKGHGCVLAWGSARHGVLGHGDLTGLPHEDQDDSAVFQPTPSIVPGTDKYEVLQVACGYSHNLVVTRTGDVLAWGSAKYGVLGLVDRAGLPSWGSSHGCDAYQPKPTVDGLVHELLPGQTTLTDDQLYRPTPTLVPALQPHIIAQVSCGSCHNLAVTSHGDVYAWGRAYCGVLGSEDRAGLSSDEKTASTDWTAHRSQYQPNPTLLAGLHGHHVVQASCGEYHNLAVTQNGTVLAWGSASYGMLGVGEVSGLPHEGIDESDVYQPNPVIVPGLSCVKSAVVSVASGTSHSVAVLLPRYIAPETSFEEDIAQGMMHDPTFADVEFVVSDADEGGAPVSVMAHKAMLCARSEYFRRQLTGSLREAGAGSASVRIEVVDIPSWAFQIVLHWIYTDKLPVIDHSTAPAKLIAVLRASDKLQLLKLKALVQIQLAEHLCASNAAEVWHCAHNANAQELEASAFMYILTHFGVLRSNPAFQEVCMANPELASMLLTNMTSPEETLLQKRKKLA
eukprot:gene2827-3624_t